MLVTGDVQQP